MHFFEEKSIYIGIYRAGLIGNLSSAYLTNPANFSLNLRTTKVINQKPIV